MPRVFWTASRKVKLIMQSKTMTVNQMARWHLQPASEIERMLKMLTGNAALIERTYQEGKHTVTVYYPAYAAGVRCQVMGERTAIW